MNIDHSNHEGMGTWCITCQVYVPISEPLLPALREDAIIRPSIVCADGFTLSVQASEFHYCSPRRNEGPYDAVEVGFPSEYEPLLAEYADGSGVFPYTPLEVVKQVVAKHGGPIGLRGQETRITRVGAIE